MAEPATGVELRDCPPRGRIELRGDPAGPGFVAGVADSVGLEPPLTPNTSRSEAECTILWLGPDAWLIEIPAEAENAVAKELEKCLSNLHASVAVVGAGSVTWSLAGSSARDVLAKGMTLDLDPRRFRAGACARSLLARVPVLLHRCHDGPVYEITVARSFFDYGLHWLRDAASEYMRMLPPTG